MSVMSIYLATIAAAAAALFVEVRVLFYSIRDGEKCRFQERTTHVAIHTMARFRQTSIQYTEWNLRQQTMWLKTDIHRFPTPNDSTCCFYGRSSFDAVLHLRIDISTYFSDGNEYEKKMSWFIWSLYRKRQLRRSSETDEGTVLYRSI